MLVVWNIISQEEREYVESKGQEFDKSVFLLKNFSSEEMTIISLGLAERTKEVEKTPTMTKRPSKLTATPPVPSLKSFILLLEKELVLLFLHHEIMLQSLLLEGVKKLYRQLRREPQLV